MFEELRWITLTLPSQQDFELVLLKANSNEEKALVGKQADKVPFFNLESSN
jgi:hypothetical protein